MPEQLLARFARKPISIYDVTAAAADRTGYAYEVNIIETKEMTAVEYDAFTENFMANYEWLAGKGGFEKEIRQVIQVAAPERTTLYVDPSGSAYGRYVGMEVSAANVIKFPEVHVRLVGKDGNAFNILGLCQRAARKAGVPKDRIQAFMGEAMNGDYNHLLETCIRWFDVY